jgi:chorismate mutase/prephenate dehydratase
MDLQQLRKQIDEIDHALIGLFYQRMDIAAQVAKYKQQNSLPVYDPVRERQKLDTLTQAAPPDRQAYVADLFALLFKLSRDEQERIMGTHGQ